MKIGGISYDSDSALIEGRETDGSAIIFPADASYAAIKVDREFCKKRLPINGPIVGGYYVVYADGYKSFSPQDSFEEGYTRIEG